VLISVLLPAKNCNFLYHPWILILLKFKIFFLVSHLGFSHIVLGVFKSLEFLQDGIKSHPRRRRHLGEAVTANGGAAGIVITLSVSAAGATNERRGRGRRARR